MGFNWAFLEVIWHLRYVHSQGYSKAGDLFYRTSCVEHARAAVVRMGRTYARAHQGSQPLREGGTGACGDTVQSMT